MSPDEIEAISELVAVKLCDAKRAKWVDPDTHDAHHSWVKQKIQDEEDRRSMRKRVIESALVWAFPLFLGFVGISMWQYIRTLLGKP